MTQRIRPAEMPAALATPTAARPSAARGDGASAWTAFGAELDRWGASGRTATFWWRDDDATDATPALDRLLALADRHAAPLALAVIPAAATAALAGRLAGTGTAVLQHGWDHANHEPADRKKAELGPARPPETVLAALAEGMRRLGDAFGEPRPLPVLVPPWNRLSPAVAAGLPGLGFRGLSTFADARFAVPGLTPANTHLDPVDWHGGRGFVGEAAALGAAVAHLRARRTGSDRAPDRPTGLLTHHLMMDDATWTFVGRFLAETARHPAARWVSAGALFGCPA